jgi:RimJ/RimL family protein N-acetyltransferase
MTEPLINLWGELVALGPISRERMPLYQRWVNDFEAVATLSLTVRPYAMEFETAWYESASSDPAQTPFDIFERATMRPIGNCSLSHIDHQHGTAEYGIFIGERDCWDKGYGTEATKLLLDYGFRSLGLHNIMLRVYGNNPRALRAYQKAGFVEVGRQREARRVGQDWVDVIYMDCLVSEYLGRD